MRPIKITKTEIVFGDSFDLAIKTIYSRKSCPTVWVRKTENIGEIISQYGSRIMFVKGVKKGINIFNMVKADVEKYRNQYVIDYDVMPETTRGQNFAFNSKAKLILTDMKHAFWRVAYLNKIISDKTYDFGKKRQYKLLRNQSLSVLGTPKYYEEWKNGQPTGRTQMLKSEDAELRRIYNFIRYECVRITEEICNKLKNDWKEWNTDGVVYVDTPRNRKIAETILNRESMLFVHKAPPGKKRKRKSPLDLRRERALMLLKKRMVKNQAKVK